MADNIFQPPLIPPVFTGGAQPYDTKPISAVLALPPAEVDDPPFSPSEYIWQPFFPPDPLPQLGTKIAGAITQPPAVDNPPFGVLECLWQPWFPPDPLPELPGKIAATIPAPVVVTYLPPRSPALVGIIASWQPPDPQPTLPRRVIPPSVDNPRPNIGSVVTLNAIVQSWQPPDPQPTQRRPTQIVSVDNPPFGQQRVAPPFVAPDLPPTLPRTLSAALISPVVLAQVPFSAAWLNAVLAAWNQQDTAPILPRRLPPVITAVEVDNPPFSQSRFQPPPVALDPLPELPGKIAPLVPVVAVTYIPSRSPALASIIASWQQVDPQPTLRRNLPPAITAVPVNNPPFGTLKGLAFGNEFIAGDWWRNVDPPLPTLPSKIAGVLGVPAPPVVNNPPFGILECTWEPFFPDPDPLPTVPKRSIFALFVPDVPPGPPITDIEVIFPDWWIPQQSPKIAGAIATPAAVRVPYSKAWLTIVLGAWQPADAPPTLPRNLNPSITAVPVNNPPFQIGGRLAMQPALLASWQPPDPQPVQKGPLSPILISVTVNNPPFSHYGRITSTASLVQAWQPDPWYATPPGAVSGWQPYGQRQLNPSIIAVPVNNPPFSHFGRAPNMMVVWTQWDLPPPPPILPWAKYVQQPVVVVYVPFSQAWMVNVVAAWQPPDPQPTQRRVTFVPGSSVDNPPPNEARADNLAAVISTWQPPDPALATVRRPTQIVSVDKPPPNAEALANFYSAISSWQPPDSPARQPRNLFLPGSSVDQPPPSARALASVAGIVQAWQPPDPALVLRTPPLVLAVRVDQPIPRQTAWFATVINAWQPDPWQYDIVGPVSGRQPYGQRQLPPQLTAVRVDNPPFDMRARTLKDVVDQWQPETWAYSRFYTRGNFIPFTQARIIKHPQLRGTFTVTTLVGIDGAPSLQGTQGRPKLQGDP